METVYSRRIEQLFDYQGSEPALGALGLSVEKAQCWSWASGLGYLSTFSPQYGVPDRDAVVAPVQSTSEGSCDRWSWHASSLPVGRCLNRWR